MLSCSTIIRSKNDTELQAGVFLNSISTIVFRNTFLSAVLILITLNSSDAVCIFQTYGERLTLGISNCYINSSLACLRNSGFTFRSGDDRSSILVEIDVIVVELVHRIIALHYESSLIVLREVSALGIHSKLYRNRLARSNLTFLLLVEQLNPWLTLLLLNTSHEVTEGTIAVSIVVECLDVNPATQ